MMAEKLIFHVDVNSAFLSWEAVDRLKNPEQFSEITVDLRTILFAVGGDRSKRWGKGSILIDNKLSNRIIIDQKSLIAYNYS